jgi:2'-5' RNA ligase
MNPERFICITLPSGEVARRLAPLRASMAAMSGAKEALSYPIHVTLRTGFLVPGDDIEAFFSDFGSCLKEWSPFPMRAGGIWRTAYDDGQTKRYLIACKVDLDERLRAFHEALISYGKYAKGTQYGYHPHITLAFHDLSPEAFSYCSEWIESRPDSLAASFEWLCDNVCLYSRAGEAWVERRKYHL